MSLEKLQHELIEKINNIIIESDDDIVKNDKEKALEIINELKDHINDKIKVSNNLKMTVLECIIRCDSQGNVRLNNRSLIDLEEAVKKVGGKTSQKLGRKQNVNERDNRNMSDNNTERLSQKEVLIAGVGCGLFGVGLVGLAIFFVYIGEIGAAALVALAVLVMLIHLPDLFITEHFTSTNLDRTTIEQHTQGTESTLSA